MHYSILSVFLILSLSFNAAFSQKKTDKKSKDNTPVTVKESAVESDESLNTLLLRKFSGDVTRYSSIEEAMRSPEKVLELDLSNQGLNSLPSGLSKFTNLTRLDVSNNNLEKLSGELSNLSNLEILDLGNNKLSSIPSEICGIKNLKELFLNGNQIHSVGNELGCLNNLQKLFLQNNGLNNLSGDIGRLQNLRYLYLFNNNLISLPAEISNLKMLQVFYVQNNKLSEDPHLTDKLDYLKYFQFEPQNSIELYREEARKAAIQASYGNSDPVIPVATNTSTGDNRSAAAKPVTEFNIDYPSNFRPVRPLATFVVVAVTLPVGPVAFAAYYAASKAYRNRIRFTRIYKAETRLKKEIQKIRPNFTRIDRLSAKISTTLNKIE
jgi:hypothetical protein